MHRAASNSKCTNGKNNRICRAMSFYLQLRVHGAMYTHTHKTAYTQPIIILCTGCGIKNSFFGMQGRIQSEFFPYRKVQDVSLIFSPQNRYETTFRKWCYCYLWTYPVSFAPGDFFVKTSTVLWNFQMKFYSFVCTANADVTFL